MHSIFKLRHLILAEPPRPPDHTQRAIAGLLASSCELSLSSRVRRNPDVGRVHSDLLRESRSGARPEVRPSRQMMFSFYDGFEIMRSARIYGERQFAVVSYSGQHVPCSPLLAVFCWLGNEKEPWYMYKEGKKIEPCNVFLLSVLLLLQTPTPRCFVYQPRAFEYFFFSSRHVARQSDGRASTRFCIPDFEFG